MKRPILSRVPYIIIATAIIFYSNNLGGVKAFAVPSVKGEELSSRKNTNSCKSSSGGISSSNTCSLSSSLLVSKMTSTDNDMQQQQQQQHQSSNEKKVIRVLALHGKGGNGADMASRLDNWQKAITKTTTTTTLSDKKKDDTTVELAITALDAPFPLMDDNDEELSWWTMPRGVRSFNALEYEGFETSQDIVMQALDKEPLFDLIMGHSQGAILLAALLAKQEIKNHPPLGYILNGVAWPNPFRKELESLTYYYYERAAAVPRILIISGQNDKINPPETANQVIAAFQKAGANVLVIPHSYGHSIPTKHDETLQRILDWIL